jgi:hypothetical protein
MSWLPEKPSMTPPESSQLMNASCFSAVRPVMGKNQCVKCVAPRSIAHSFIACATVCATSGESRSPFFTVLRTALNTSRGRRSCMVRQLKVFTPKYVDTFA